MGKYRKKPVVVEAEQWFPGRETPGVFGSENGGHYVETVHLQKVFLRPGDWVIREPDGVHYYPCKPDVFAATYEPVEGKNETCARDP